MKTTFLLIAMLFSMQLSAQITTLFQADFSNPLSYTLNNNGGGDWIITANAPQGTSSQAMGAMTSATPAEFALFDSDFLGGVNQYATITMNDMIDASGFIYIYVCFESYYKQGPGQCSLDVSTDGGATWTEHVVHDTVSLPPGSMTANPTSELVEISAAAAGTPSAITLRFTYSGAPGDAWMVDNLCVQASNTSTLGVENLAEENSFVVYPNPTSGEFVVDLSALNGTSEVRVTDFQGRLLLSKIVDPSMTSIELNLDEAPGTYIVTVIHAEGEARSTMIKK